MVYFELSKIKRAKIKLVSYTIKLLITKILYRKQVIINGPVLFYFWPKFNVKGKGSLEINCSSLMKLGKCTFLITGNKNKVELSGGGFIKEVLFWFEGNENSLIFGKNSTAEDVCFYFSDDKLTIEIGDNSMIAKKVEFRTGDSHLLFDHKTSQRINISESISIGSKNWIANNVSILKGVKSESNIVFGANSTVLKNIKLESNSVYAGSPARRVRSNIYWER